jgi:hypothetical protein
LRFDLRVDLYTAAPPKARLDLFDALDPEIERECRMLGVVALSLFSRCAFLKNSQGLGTGKATSRKPDVSTLYEKAAPPTAPV